MSKRILNTYTDYKYPTDLFTEAEQIDQCCEKVDCDPCVEVGKVEVYNSAESEELDLPGMLASARAENPDKYITGAKLIDVGPTGPCGEMHTTWTGRLNCCDGVEPLVWDSDNSVGIIADMSSGIVVVTGGRLPFQVSVRGSGFYLDQKNAREGVVDGRNIRIYTSDACGSCTVTISDGCSVVVHKIKSTNGQWVTEYYNNSGGVNGYHTDTDDIPGYPNGCVVTGTGTSDIGNSSKLKTFVAEDADYRITQIYSRREGSGYFARRPYDDESDTDVALSNVVNECRYRETLKPTTVVEGRLSGGCFTFENSCVGCDNECLDNHYETAGDLYAFSYDLGFHSAATTTCTATSGWCYLWTGWSLVVSTKVERWVC